MVTIPCPCPPTADGEPRHADGDTVELRERLDFAAGRTARNIIAIGKAEGTGTAQIMTELTGWYIVSGIASWTVVDAKGKPVEPDAETIHRLILDNPDTSAAEAIGDACDDLYSERVISPLLVRGSTSSPDMPTNGSTSLTTGSTSKPRKPSKPSSTTTTPTADIVTISPSRDGVSSSSQKSA